MEARLTLRAGPAGEPAAVRSEVEPASRSEESVVAADIAARVSNGTESESINVWPDEAAEASFIAEARERGEPVAAAKPSAPAHSESEEETGSKNLPALDTLIGRLSPEVRESLDDLFRAKFTSVRRVPKKAFKT